MKGTAVPVNCLKVYGRVEVQFHSFLTSAPGGSELPASGPAASISRTVPMVYVEYEAGLRLRAGLGPAEKRKTSCYRESKSDPAVINYNQFVD